MHAPTLKHMHAPTQAASWKALLSVRLSSWEEPGLDRQRRKENRTRRFGFGTCFGAKEDNSEQIWRGGADMSDFISFPLLRCCLSERSLLAAAWSKGAQHGENRSPQHSPEAAGTHQPESPSAMTRRHLSGDLDWLVPKTSRPPQMSPNQF